jgi:hypothetical protein
MEEAGAGDEVSTKIVRQYMICTKYGRELTYHTAAILKDAAACRAHELGEAGM